MRWSYAMMSLRVTLLVEDKGANVDGVDRDGDERKGGAADPNYLDQNYASFHLMVAVSMAHM